MITQETRHHGRTLEPGPVVFHPNPTEPPRSDEVVIYTLHDYTLVLTGSHYRPDLNLAVLADHVRRFNSYLTPALITTLGLSNPGTGKDKA